MLAWLIKQYRVASVNRYHDPSTPEYHDRGALVGYDCLYQKKLDSLRTIERDYRLTLAAEALLLVIWCLGIGYL